MRTARVPRTFTMADRQSGFSLIVSLMMLIVIIILGVGASQMAINEERASRNDRDRQIAFQAAEAALKDAEFEISGAASPTACTQTGQPPSRARPISVGSGQTCFNKVNSSNYVTGCSTYPNGGLCASDGATPDWLSTSLDFLGDAKATSTSGLKTVQFGQFTNQTFGAQVSAIAPVTTGLGTSMPVSIYPPRYIIELVPLNTSVTTLTSDGAGGGLGTGHMFRVTAMGFGANANSQVVLQTIIATRN